MARRRRQGWLSPGAHYDKDDATAKLVVGPPYGCLCGDETRAGWYCEDCGERAKLWMTEEEFNEYCRLNPLD